MLHLATVVVVIRGLFLDLGISVTNYRTGELENATVLMH